MYKIDGKNATEDGQFREYDPATGQGATYITADWLNAVQGELIGILLAADIEPSKATNGQVLAALEQLFASKQLLAGEGGADLVGYGSGTVGSALASLADSILGALTGGAPIYESAAAGIADTAEGEYFNVVSSDPNVALILYRHGAGDVAIEEKKTASNEAWNETTDMASQGARLVGGYASVRQINGIDYLLCIEDVNGILRVIEESTGSDFKDYAALNSDKEVASSLSLDDYPEMVKCVLDANGVLRVVYRLDANEGADHYSESDSVFTPTPTEYVVFLVAGQSNAHGSSRDPENSPVPRPGWAYHWNGTDLSPLQDPWATAAYGSAWPSFAIKFTELTGKGAIMIDAATGGTAMVPDADIGNGYWGGTGGGLREAAVSDLNACLAYLRGAGYAYQFGGVLWSQGERDAQSIDASTITRTEYETAWSDFMAYMRGQIGSFWPLVVSRTGTADSGDTAGFQAIRDAQDTLCAGDQFVLMGFTGAVNFPALGMMYDELHYDQAGLNKMGEAMAQSCAQMSASTSIAV